MQPASQLTLTVDASPWGFGGVFCQCGTAKELFSEAVSAEDQDILSVTVGSPDGQQVLEAMALLIALRTWRPRWIHARAAVAIRGDNVTMLTMIAKLKSRGGALSVIAREIALEVAAAAYRPFLVEHVPGVANGVADALSRKAQPGKVWTLPAALSAAVRVEVPRRGRSWYRALVPPAGDPP